jgi:hypothetical protein
MLLVERLRVAYILLLHSTRSTSVEGVVKLKAETLNIKAQGSRLPSRRKKIWRQPCDLMV